MLVSSSMPTRHTEQRAAGVSSEGGGVGGSAVGGTEGGAAGGTAGGTAGGAVGGTAGGAAAAAEAGVGVCIEVDNVFDIAVYVAIIKSLILVHKLERICLVYIMALVKLKNIICCNQTLRHYCIYDHNNVPIHGLQCLKDKAEPRGFPLNKIMTWNIQELFWYVAPGKLSNVLDYLRQCECGLVCLQEVFESSSLESIIYDVNIRLKYPFFLTGDMRNRYVFGENSGLLVLSAYPITLVKFIPLSGCEFPDSLASKGILFFSVGNKNFATAHLQSGNQRIAGYQLKHILMQSPFGRDFTLLGDLNHVSAEAVLKVDKTNNLVTHESNRILDYILPLGDDRISVSRDTINLNNTTDHYPLIGVYQSEEAPPSRPAEHHGTP